VFNRDVSTVVERIASRGGLKISGCSKSVVLSIGLNPNRDLAAGQLSPPVGLSCYTYACSGTYRFHGRFR
jgi:hypothetical protein